MTLSKKQCTRCGADLKPGNRFKYGGEENLCTDCLAERSNEDSLCPNCGTVSNNDEVTVGLLLTPVGSSKKDRINAVDTLVNVCPNCHILYFDNFHYKLIEGLLSSQPQKK